MPESDQLVVAYTCPKDHQGTLLFTKEDLEKAVAEGVLTCHCDHCNSSYSSSLAETDVESIQKLIDQPSGEQCAEPVCPNQRARLV
jgi:cob(I)alamin adenosyltransferase